MAVGGWSLTIHVLLCVLCIKEQMWACVNICAAGYWIYLYLNDQMKDEKMKLIFFFWRGGFLQ